MVSILFILFTATLLIPFDFELTASDVKAVFETKHTRNTRKAEAFNQEMWNSGFADIYTIKATIKVKDELRSISVDVICVPKIETAGANIKGGPYVWDLPRNFNPPEILMSISGNYFVLFDTIFSCESLSQNAEKRGYPFIDRSFQTAVIQHIVEPILSCRQSLYEGEIQFKELWVFPLEVMSVRQERVSDVLTREEYGPTDRANKPKRGRPPTSKFQVSYGHSFHWSDKEMCWLGRRGGTDRRRGQYECSSLAQEMCPQFRR